MNIAYNFYIKINQCGRHCAKMEFGDPYQTLNRLGDDDYAHSQVVRDILVLLRDEVNEEDFDFAPNDFLIIEVHDVSVFVSSGFDEFTPYSITRHELIEIYTEWLDFLEVYENNQIPGVIFH